MPLVTLEHMLGSIGDDCYGIGAFNVANMEMVMGATKAGEELQAPIILQVAEGRLRYSPLSLIGPVMVAAAEQAKIPVVVHLDHGATLGAIREALELGFSSVMFDGSHYPLAENIKRTQEVRAIAKQYGASVEGEIGKVGGSESDEPGVDVLVTSVAEAKRFYEETQVDALAVAIGTVHGHYKEKPNLQFDRLQEIAAVIGCPLVLHGGSGLTENDFKLCIQHKIKKVNIATASFESVARQVDGLVRQSERTNYFALSDAMVNATCDNVKHHIQIFGSNNKVNLGG